MKVKVIVYGWAFSWLFLLAGADAMDHGDELAGCLLMAVWFLFSWLLILNEKECVKEADRFDAWMEKTMARLMGGRKPEE